MSALPLLVARIGANNHHSAMPADDFALLAYRFDGGTDLHARLSCLVCFTLVSLLVSIGDPTSGEVVRGEFNLNLVSRENTDVVHPHLSGDVGQNLVAIFELDPKHGVWEGLGDCAFKHNRIVLWLWQNVLLGRCTVLLPGSLVTGTGHRPDGKV
jgi:hypothetical protein